MIQFTNPLHFLSHFSTNSALSLQPGQDLRIDEVGNLWESETLSGVQEPPSSAKNRALFTLNKIMHLAGKTLKFEGGGEIEFTCKDSLTLSGSGRLTLIAEYGDIVTRLSDLFRMMLVNSVRAISLQPRQRLIVYDLHNDETPELFPRTYIARAPSGTIPQISRMGEIKERKVDYFGLRLTRSMTIEPQPALRLELHGFNLFPGETHFVNRMRIRDDLPLPSGCSLTITSKELKETWAEYRKSLPPLEALQAALSSPFLIEGQQIVLSSNASLSLKTMSEGIHVLSTGTTTFYRREAQQLTTHGADLYRALLSARETSYRVPTHSGLKLVGIGAEESVSDFFRRTAPAGLDVAVFGERPIQRGEGWALLLPSVPLHIEIAPSSPANVLHRLIAKYGLNLETKGQRAFLLNHFFYETLTGHARKFALFHPELLRTLKAKTLEKILGILSTPEAPFRNALEVLNSSPMENLLFTSLMQDVNAATGIAPQGVLATLFRELNELTELELEGMFMEEVVLKATPFTVGYQWNTPAASTCGTDLFEAMLTIGTDMLTIPAGRTLRLEGISPEESVAEYLRKNAPEGLNAQIFGAYIFQGDTLTASEPVTIRLKPKSAVQLSKMLIAKHKIEIDEPEGMIFFLNLLMHHLLTGYPKKLRALDHDLITKLKPSTVAGLLNILNNPSAPFRTAMDTLFQSPEALQRYNELLNGTAEDFIAVDISALPIPLPAIFHELNRLAQSELSGKFLKEIVLEASK